MDRTQLVAATAALLFAAFLLGWFAGWLIHRMTRPDPAMAERLARQLQAAEQARDRALQDHAAREARLSERLAKAEAEAHAALNALRASQGEMEALRDHVERTLARPRPPRA